jgi:putative transcriptional regulator
MSKRATAYKSDAMASAHEIASALYKVGGIDKKTMRQFDEDCLTPIVQLNPDEIRALREREEVSQAVFARYLNVATDTVTRWETGVKHPAGTSLKLLSLVKKNGLSAIL